AANCAAGSCAPATSSLILDRFPFDRSTLPPFHAPAIDSMGRAVVRSWKTARPIRTIRMVVHADSRGPAAYNLSLGGRRALAVRDRLAAVIRRLKPDLIARIKFTPQTQGSTRPIAPSTTPQGRARNRRVEIFLWRV